MDLQGFDASKVDPAAPKTVIPAGKYLAAIVESEKKDMKSGNGYGLNLTWEILDGECKGRKLFSWLNIGHNKPDVVQFSLAELSAICRAVGVMTPKDSIELHNLPCLLDVGLRKNKQSGENENVIKAFENRNTRSQSQPQETAPGATEPPPWMRKG